MLAEKKYVNIDKINKVDNIIQFPSKNIESRIGQSTKMWCLRNKEEIKQVYDVFLEKLNDAQTDSKMSISLRNMTMFVCAINIGLRGGDFCNLKWSDIYDSDWNFKDKAEYVPQKTRKCHKHIDLYWNSDFEYMMNKWLEWKNQRVERQGINGYIFTSQKGNHITEKAWYKIMEKTRREAGIKQKIGTHGLRKTMANQYIKCAEDKGKALVEVSNMLGHSDLRITERYACLEDEDIRNGKEKTAFLFV